MDAKYLLERLYKASALARKAQREYYACRGDFKTDPLKKQYYAEAKRREADLDTCIKAVEHQVPGIDVVLTMP